MVQFQSIVLDVYLPLHLSGMNVFKPRRIDGDHSIIVFNLISLFTLVIFSPTLVVMGNSLVYGPIKGQVI